jgi:hypothetical protein
MGVWLRLLCVYIGSCLATGSSPVQGVILTVETEVKQSVSWMPYAPKWEQLERKREENPNAVAGTSCDDVKCLMLIVSLVFVKLMFFPVSGIS